MKLNAYFKCEQTFVHLIGVREILGHERPFSRIGRAGARATNESVLSQNNKK